MGRPVVMKRPADTTTHKSEKTAEFVLPDLALIKSDSTSVIPTMPSMPDAPPPVAPIQAKVVQEKKETLSKLDQEIADSKKEVVRQVDEKTTMFNLRQLEMEQKTLELEEKKARVEQELNHLLTMKNSKFHEELKLATETLIDETKKIAPLEKSLEGLVDSIQKIRLEMIRLFNQGLEERKKSVEELAATKVEVTKMSGLVQDTVGELSVAYRDILSASKRTLNDFETDSVKLRMVKQETDHVALEKERQQGSLEIIAKNIELKQQLLSEVQAEVQAKKSEAEKLAKEVLDWQETLRSHDSKMSACRQAIADVEALTSGKKAELAEARAALSQLQVESENLKVSMDILKGAHERKQKNLGQLEHEITESVKRSEAMKHAEVEIMRALGNLELAKAVATGDLAALESQKAAMLTVVQEVKQLQEAQDKLLAEKKEDLLQRFKTEEDRHHLELQQKIHDWELQFTEHCVSRKAALSKELEELSLAHSESLLKLKDAFLVEAKKSVIDILDVKEFAGRAERIKAMQTAFDVAASNFILAPIANHHARWKRAFWCALVMSVALSGLLIWKW